RRSSFLQTGMAGSVVSAPRLRRRIVERAPVRTRGARLDQSQQVRVRQRRALPRWSGQDATVAKGQLDARFIVLPEQQTKFSVRIERITGPVSAHQADGVIGEQGGVRAVVGA